MDLVGTYRLISCKIEWSDGKVSLPYGEAPEGLLVYTRSGHMSGHLMRRGVPAFKGGARAGSPEEIDAAFRGYLGYFGTYTVDQDAGAVTHHVAGSWYPNWIGTDQIRYIRWDSGDLVLATGPRQVGARTKRSFLVWRRVNDS